MCGHVAADDGARSDYGPFSDCHIRQHHTVRPNEYIFFNDNFSIAGRSPWARVNVGDDRRSHPDDAVVSDRYICGMYFIDVHKLGNPDIVSDRNSAQTLQPGPNTEAPGSDKGELAGKPAEQNRQPQRMLPLACLVTRICSRVPMSPENLKPPYSIHCSVFPLRRTLTGA